MQPAGVAAPASGFTFRLSHTDTGAATSPKLQILRDRQGGLGSIHPLEGTPTEDVLDLEPQFGIGPHASLRQAAFGGGQIGVGFGRGGRGQCLGQQLFKGRRGVGPSRKAGRQSQDGEGAADRARRPTGR